MKTSYKYYTYTESLNSPPEVDKLKINLDSDDIIKIESQAHLFQKLNSIRLSSESSSVKHLPTNLLRLSGLKDLSIVFEKSKTLPPEIFNLNQLESISIRSNALEKIPIDIWELTNIKLLQFFRCDNIKVIPEGISSLTKLNYLRVYSNSVVNLPLDLGYCLELQTVDVNSKSLNKIPDSINMSENLNLFRWAYCKGYPEIINECKTLKKLSFDFNKFTAIPDSISNLPNLESLNLSFSSFENLPESITRIKNLKTLDLYDNKIINLPETLVKLTKLEKLNLNYCTNLNSNLENLIYIFNSMESLQTVTFMNVDLTESQKQILCNSIDERIKIYV